jgi:hypothetical protein
MHRIFLKHLISYIPPEYLGWDADVAELCILEPQIGMNKIWAYVLHIVSACPRGGP